MRGSSVFADRTRDMKEVGVAERQWTYSVLADAREYVQ